MAPWVKNAIHTPIYTRAFLVYCRRSLLLCFVHLVLPDLRQGMASLPIRPCGFVGLTVITDWDNHVTNSQINSPTLGEFIKCNRRKL